MKGLGLVKKLVVIILTILVSAVAFFGVYTSEKGIWTSKLKKYNYGMDFNGYRELRFVLDDSEATEKEYYVDDNGNIVGEVVEEEGSLTNTEINLVDDQGNPIETDDAAADATKEDDPTSAYKKEKRMVSPNPAEVRTQENFEKTKKIIQKRLEKINGYEYNFRMDNETGDITLEVPDDDDIIMIQESLMTTKGKFTISDAQNGLILLDNSEIESAQAYPYENQIFLLVQYEGESAKKLNELSTKYVKASESASDSEESSASSLNVNIMIDDTKLATTYFGYVIKDGLLQLSLGEKTEDAKELMKSYNEVAALANTIQGETLPLEYELSSDNYLKSEIDENMKRNIKYAFAIVIALVSLAMIIKYKVKGLMAAALSCLYAAGLTLVLRYTNVYITMNALVTYVIALLLNYGFLFSVLKHSSDEESGVYGKVIKDYYLKTIPVWVVGLIFTFASGVAISSIGMVAFWAMFVQLILVGLTYVFDLV